MFDMSRCPQTEDEARDWFFAGIGKKIGDPAGDWETVMANCGLPPGYGPGVVPNAMMPYFAFTQQFSGGPKGRMFLPTSTPDELNYYTRCMQYLDDAAKTYSKKRNPKQDFKMVSPSGLVWAFYWVAGNEYDPVQPANAGPPVLQPDGDFAARLKALEDNAVKLGDKIALRTNSGLLAGIKGGGPTAPDAPISWIGKIGDPHAWESLKIEKGE